MIKAPTAARDANEQGAPSGRLLWPAPLTPDGRKTELPKRLGVVGAGTMGSGIAQLGCLAGMETFLHDPVEEALVKGASGCGLGWPRA